MIVDTLLAKVIGTQNERDLKRLRRSSPKSTPKNRRSRRSPTSSSATRRRSSASGSPTAKRSTICCPEAFAVVREAGRRVLNMRHFDVQLIGGIVLHRGKIAEMKTGEGKTLVATLPAYLNALAGKGVHVVTVNDYLARRDSEWMGRLYRFLGMSVGVIQHDLNDQERQVAYAADITYGTNNEFGFDYLRDNMKFDLAHYVQRGHHFAIVDEVDSILIDEARTPLIISGPAEESTDLYYEVDRIIPKLTPGAVTQGNVKAEDREELEKTGDYIVDEKHKTVTLTETGMAKAEKMLAHRLLPGRPLRPGEHAAPPPHQPGAPRAHALPARRRLHDQGRRRRHRRRVHRPPDAGPALERRPAPGGRGEGEGQDRAREPDARDRHLPELLPQVQEARRHDRHGRHRSGRVQQDLQARRHGHADQPRAAPRRGARHRLPHRAREVRGDRHRHHREAEAGAAGPRRHRLDREVGAALEAAQAPRHQARRPQREVPRAGSGDRRAGRAQEHGHDRDQHGRPRHRHPARRQPGVHGAAADARRRDRRAAAEGPGEVRRRRGVRLLLPPRQLLPRVAPRVRADLRGAEAADRRGARRGRRARRPAHHRDRAPRGAPHRQPAPRPRRPSGRSRVVAVLPVARRRPDADLRVGPHRRPDAAARHGRRRPHRAQDGDQGDRARAEAGRGAELLRPQAPPRIRRRDEQAAREHLRAAPGAARGEDPHHGRGSGRHPRVPDDARRGAARQHGRHVHRPGSRPRGARPGRAHPDGRRDLRRRSGGAAGEGPRGHAARGDDRHALGADPREVRDQGEADSDRDPAARRARHHAADRRRPVEGPPLQPRPPEGRHRPARLRAARSARRVQEGELRALHRDEGPGRGRDRPVSVAADAGRRRRCVRRGCSRPAAHAAAAAAAADHAELAAGLGAVAVRGRRRERRRAARRTRRVRRAPAATTWSARSSATSRKSAATIPARAAAGRNSRSAMARDPRLARAGNGKGSGKIAALFLWGPEWKLEPTS